MRRIILTTGLLIALLWALTGCGKKNKKAGPDATVPVTEEPTPEPFRDFTEEYAGTVRFVDEQGNTVWSCGGSMAFTSSAGGIGGGDSWEIYGSLESYTVKNADGRQLFTVRVSGSAEGRVYTLSVGSTEQELSKIQTDVLSSQADRFQIYSVNNRMVFLQNGKTLLVITAKQDEMIVAAPDGENAKVYRFPVRNFTVSETEGKSALSVPKGRLLPAVESTDPEELLSLSGTHALATLFDTIRKASYREWPASYVQITKKKETAGSRSTEYRASYHEDSVVVNRTDSSAPSTVTEYAFETLSEGTTTVEYYTFSGGFDKLEYTFEADELDDYRTGILASELARQKAADAYENGLISVSLTRTAYGYEERGVAGDGSYIRYYFTVWASGSILTKYSGDGKLLSMRFYALSDREGNVYADGDPEAAEPENALIRYEYDEYGVCVSEQSAQKSISYEYAFTDIAFDGENDTVRHEWRELMPYLENAPKIPPTGKDEPDDGEDSDDADEDNSGDGDTEAGKAET